MKLHANAALSLTQRRRMVLRVIEQGWSIKAAAAAAETSPRTCGKWVARYRSGREFGLLDLSSAPRVVANRTCERRIGAIAALRRLRFSGPDLPPSNPKPGVRDFLRMVRAPNGARKR